MQNKTHGIKVLIPCMRKGTKEKRLRKKGKKEKVNEERKKREKDQVFNKFKIGRLNDFIITITKGRGVIFTFPSLKNKLK